MIPGASESLTRVERSVHLALRSRDHGSTGPLHETVELLGLCVREAPVCSHERHGDPSPVPAFLERRLGDRNIELVPQATLQRLDDGPLLLE